MTKNIPEILLPSVNLFTYLPFLESEVPQIGECLKIKALISGLPNNKQNFINWLDHYLSKLFGFQVPEGEEKSLESLFNKGIK